MCLLDYMHKNLTSKDISSSIRPGSTDDNNGGRSKRIAGGGMPCRRAMCGGACYGTMQAVSCLTVSTSTSFDYSGVCADASRYNPPIPHTHPTRRHCHCHCTLTAHWRYPNTDFQGSKDISSSANVTTAVQCCQLCDRTPTCAVAAWSWPALSLKRSTWTRGCWLDCNGHQSFWLHDSVSPCIYPYRPSSLC